MSHKEKNEILLDLYRTEIIEGAKLRDNLYDENNRLLIDNDELVAEVEKLSEELSYAHCKIERLEEKLKTLEMDDGIYIKVENNPNNYVTDEEQFKGIKVPDVLKKSPAATDDRKDL